MTETLTEREILRMVETITETVKVTETEPAASEVDDVVETEPSESAHVEDAPVEAPDSAEAGPDALDHSAETETDNVPSNAPMDEEVLATDARQEPLEDTPTESALPSDESLDAPAHEEL